MKMRFDVAGRLMLGLAAPVVSILVLTVAVTWQGVGDVGASVRREAKVATALSAGDLVVQLGRETVLTQLWLADPSPARAARMQAQRRATDQVYPEFKPVSGKLETQILQFSGMRSVTDLRQGLIEARRKADLRAEASPAIIARFNRVEFAAGTVVDRLVTDAKSTDLALSHELWTYNFYLSSMSAANIDRGVGVDIIAAANPAQRAEYQRAMIKQWGMEEEDLVGAEEVATPEEAALQRAELNSADERLRDLLRTRLAQPGAGAIKTTLDAWTDAATAVIDRRDGVLHRLQRNLSQAAEVEMRESLGRLVMIVASLLAVIAGSAFVGFWLIRSICSPLRDLIRDIRHLTEPDRPLSLSAEQRRDEFGVAGRAVREVRDVLTADARRHDAETAALRRQIEQRDAAIVQLEGTLDAALKAAAPPADENLAAAWARARRLVDRQT